ncbi:E3 ubiquitin-protein ligase UPL4-like isoform X1 [Cucurbita pepo subsp. pepo]|uniref:E3 ubiquitin-protein ligase UPL4-like isoform X1 n=2 Tax=Cucurbita pepo subsp. pepo TaxID=3664 RepID=UPI000C9D41E3|nr:E3 ubiquitin-protein ligase UPL4-like isoform X1 [Cucurbita pepo subsp. pepo]
MGNRGQKRAEMVDRLPADKRTCSSLEFRPSSSNSSVQMHVTSTNSSPGIHENDMDTSSSASASSRSEGEHDKDSAYGSCDSDDAEQKHSDLRNCQRQRSSSDHERFKRILSSLGEESDTSAQILLLTDLCEVLSFCMESSLSSTTSDSLSIILVNLVKLDSNSEIVLLALRALTYLCDAYPRASSFIVRHGGVPALCQRLGVIVYLDVAEQCLQALERISQEHPVACLEGGAVMAVLTFIDFFSSSIQRTALRTVVNICKKLPSECPQTLIEAVPILCNLFQHDDGELVENVARCMIKIAECAHQSCEILDGLCQHGLIQQVIRLINLNSRTSLSQTIYNDLLGILVKLSSGSIVAFKTLYELDISNTLKEILSVYNLSHGMSSCAVVDGQRNQVCEVLKLLNELLPTEDAKAEQLSEKVSFLASNPKQLQKFGLDILPLLVQVVSSGAKLYVCCGCLTIIYKFICLGESDMLVELLQNANISSFLVGVFTRKDHHVLMLALKITEIILQKLCSIFLKSFVKEGVYFAIGALITPEKYKQLIFPVFAGVHPSFGSCQKSTRENGRCLCYAFSSGCFSSVAETGSCKLDDDSVYSLANHIRNNYFTDELCDTDKGVSDILQNLLTFSGALDDLLNLSLIKDTPAQDEEKFYALLAEIMSKLKCGEPISTFEFIESGIVKSFINYLTNGQYLRKKGEPQTISRQFSIMERRFEAFARLLFSSSDHPSVNLPVRVLLRKLQISLSSLENFPVISSQGFKHRNYFATVPNGRCIPHPCVKVRFVRGDGETDLCDITGDILTVDPFSSLNAIEGFLWPKVSRKKAEQSSEADSLREHQVKLLSNVCSYFGVNSELVGSNSKSSDLPEIEVSVEVSTDEKSQGSASSSKKGTKPKLLLYLEGKQLEPTLTLYQTILQQHIKENEAISGTKVWSQVYTIMYKRAGEVEDNSCNQFFSASDKGATLHFSSFFCGILDCDLPSDLARESPVYDVLFLLRIIEGMNRMAFHIMSHERIRAFSEGRISTLDNIKLSVPSVSQNEFVNSKLTEKLEQQMRDFSAVSIGGMPLWCKELMDSCPFLFSFEARRKYFRIVVFGMPQQPYVRSYSDLGTSNGVRSSSGGLPRKKALVLRDKILLSAAKMMDQYAHQKVLLEVEYDEEVGTGLGPTLEFYTLVSQEFQKYGLGMWRGDHDAFIPGKSLNIEGRETIESPFGLFPRPWLSTVDIGELQFSEVIKKFTLMGQIVAKAIQDGRVMDIYFSKAFYKLILGQEVSIYDIQSFDPELGTVLLEFQALVNRSKLLESVCEENSSSRLEFCYHDTNIEDLCLDFTLPGYPDCRLTSSQDNSMVNTKNLEDYVSLVADATLYSGISTQIEAFKSGFNQVFPIEHLQVFTAEELERLICGEQDSWALSDLLDNIKFDHGYTASSPSIINLLEIIQDFDNEQQRAFLQFVTGAPRLPSGGFASLNPKLTIVRKHSSNMVDSDLPSVMTCANYLKLPPYSSKEIMKEKLLYAITEGQGSFHLS